MARTKSVKSMTREELEAHKAAILEEESERIAEAKAALQAVEQRLKFRDRIEKLPQEWKNKLESLYDVSFKISFSGLSESDQKTLAGIKTSIENLFLAGPTANVTK